MSKHIYTNEEDQFLIDNVKGISLKELRSKFNKKFNLDLSESAISNRKRKLNIKSGIVGGRFEKGNIPFNKGMKWDEYMSKECQIKSSKTTFKKGNIPNNRREIGEERITVDGYVEVKVKDGCLNDNWKYKHRYIYEKEYGDIPEGYKVIFADGNKRNFNTDNLILVSNSEELIMNRNNLFYDEKELTKTGTLIAKVIDKTNKVKNEKL